MEEIKQKVSDRIEQELYDEVLAEHCTSGKMARAVLSYKISRYLDIDEDVALDISAGIEIFHNQTLVTDDIMDGHDERRGVPALWREKGLSKAVNDSNELIFVSQKLVSPYYSELPSKMHDLYKGQRMDLETPESLDELLTSHRLKTGTLFELCADIPYAVAGVEKDFQLYDLGMYQQVRDDISDYPEEDTNILDYVSEAEAEEMAEGYRASLSELPEGLKSIVEEVVSHYE